ncbi:MAG: ABC transporter permease [Opitutaceae bacterium]|jgi:lipoprotein-releasing system permease protein|nr:ABC transporter permease [Opitutaceae bacterium]
MPWYLHLALRQLFPSGRRVPFFTVMSITGVLLGVALLYVSTSVMGGFGFEIRRMIVETQGDVQVRSGSLIADPAPALAAIRATKGVTGATPVAEGVVMLEHKGRPVFPAIQGVDPATVGSVVPLDRYMRAGSLDDLDDDGVILSAQLASALGARVGDRVEVTSPLLLERLKSDEVFLPRELRVAGVFEIGHQHLDKNVAVVTLRRMQDLYGLGKAVHGVNVRLAPGADADAAAAVLDGNLPPGAGRARSWKAANEGFLYVIQLEKNLIFFLLMFIVVVAAFSLASSLLTSVVRKTREIGLLRALGAGAGQVAACFCLQGFLIGVWGTVLGLGAGWVFMFFRNDILGAFMRLTSRESEMLQFYNTNLLPAHLSAADFWIIVGFSVCVSTLAGLLPAWRASRLKPTEALRND